MKRLFLPPPPPLPSTYLALLLPQLRFRLSISNRNTLGRERIRPDKVESEFSPDQLVIFLRRTMAVKISALTTKFECIFANVLISVSNHTLQKEIPVLICCRPILLTPSSRHMSPLFPPPSLFFLPPSRR